jgi:cytochrome b561-like protein
MKLVSRYHPLLVTLHWLLAVLILAALAVGFFALAAMENADPRKIAVLRWHMAGGMLILALMIIRPRRPPSNGEAGAGQSPRVGRALRFLPPGRPDGGDGLCDGACRRPAGDRVRGLRCAAA